MIDRHEAISALIEADLTLYWEGDDTLANALRCAASAVLLDYPDCTSGEFADICADEFDLHHQGSRNRFNEAVKWQNEMRAEGLL